MKNIVKQIIGLGQRPAGFFCKRNYLTRFLKHRSPDTAFDSRSGFEPGSVDLPGTQNGNFYGGRYQVYGDIRADDFINENHQRCYRFRCVEPEPAGYFPELGEEPVVSSLLHHQPL